MVHRIRRNWLSRQQHMAIPQSPSPTGIVLPVSSVVMSRLKSWESGSYPLVVWTSWMVQVCWHFLRIKMPIHNYHRCLPLGNLRAEKGECHLYKADVYKHAKGSMFVAVPPPALNEAFDFDLSFKKVLQEYRDVLGENLYMAASRAYSGDDAKMLFRIYQLSAQLQVPMVATNDVHYHHPNAGSYRML